MFDSLISIRIFPRMYLNLFFKFWMFSTRPAKTGWLKRSSQSALLCSSTIKHFLISSWISGRTLGTFGKSMMKFSWNSLIRLSIVREL